MTDNLPEGYSIEEFDPDAVAPEGGEQDCDGSDDTEAEENG